MGKNKKYRIGNYIELNFLKVASVRFVQWVIQHGGLHSYDMGLFANGMKLAVGLLGVAVVPR